MQKFLMTIGLPGSGKSTYSEELINSIDTTWIIVSSDSIRETVFGDVNNQSHNGEVFNIMFNRTKKGLKEGHSVYYDATNLSSKRRIGLIKELKKIAGDFEINCILFAPSFEVCLERNMNRDRVVPEYAMKRMFKSFEPPHKSEGWDNIYFNSNN